MRQARAIKARLAEAFGDGIDLPDRRIHAFPRPAALVDLAELPGLSSVKTQRLRDLARAAVEGRLATARLRAMPEADALAALEALPGVGRWTAEAVLFRGCGVADALPLADGISRRAVGHVYGDDELPDEAWLSIAEAWRPYRMWGTVLIHLAWRREQPGRPSYRQGRG